MRFDGGSDRFDLLGAKLLPGFSKSRSRATSARSSAAARAAAAITVAGDAGPYAASQNRLALISTSTATPGTSSARRSRAKFAGMSGGRVIVRGSVGARAGDRLRRGIIIVEGDAGDDLGSRRDRRHDHRARRRERAVGYLNKRGSIVLGKARELGPTYVDCGAHDLSFAKLYSKALAADSASASGVLSQKLRRFGGDTAVFGKGEILTPL